MNKETRAASRTLHPVYYHHCTAGGGCIGLPTLAHVLYEGGGTVDMLDISAVGTIQSTPCLGRHVPL